MEYRQLGKTNIQVSVIGFGCVEIGQNYGIHVPGDYGKPDRKSSIELIKMAADLGLNLFDTAPSYGDSEKILGLAIGSRPDCYIATKVNIPRKDRNAEESIRTSINQSCTNIKREYLDIVQIHNASIDVINQSDVLEILIKLRKEGKIRFIGASVYGLENAMEVINAGCFDVLQIAYNILDQRMADKVIPLATQSDFGVLTRSPYFKGVLTVKSEYLSKDCSLLKEASRKVKNTLDITEWEELTSLALGFCLSNRDINSVIVGIRTQEELKFALQTVERNRLSDETCEKMRDLGLNDRYWLNPANWPFV